MPYIQTIDPKAAKDLLDKNEAVIIDVRETAEHEAQRIPGAKLIPLGVINADDLKPYAGKKIIIHCQLGRRGGVACDKLLTAAPDLQIYNLEGGLAAWENNQLPVEPAHSNFIGLDRQVQITIGSGVLLGVVLGYFVSAAFLLLAAFFGAGLLYAGFSGTCTLALLMAKMPWNKGSSVQCK